MLAVHGPLPVQQVHRCQAWHAGLLPWPAAYLLQEPPLSAEARRTASLCRQLSASHISVGQLLLALAVQVPVQVTFEEPREGSWHLDIKAGVGYAGLHAACHLLQATKLTSPLKAALSIACCGPLPRQHPQSAK